MKKKFKPSKTSKVIKTTNKIKKHFTEEEELDLKYASLQKYGFDHQVMKLVEECGEFIQQAAQFSNREPLEHPFTKFDRLIEELCDIKIVLDQLFIVLYNDATKKIYQSKLRKLHSYLK